MKDEILIVNGKIHRNPTSTVLNNLLDVLDVSKVGSYEFNKVYDSILILQEQSFLNFISLDSEVKERMEKWNVK